MTTPLETIPVEGREAIGRARHTDSKSIRRIARNRGPPSRTVRKAIGSGEPTPYALKVPGRAPMLDPHNARTVALGVDG